MKFISVILFLSFNFKCFWKNYLRKSRYWELNPGPFTYKANALPLSYTGSAIQLYLNYLKNRIKNEKILQESIAINFYRSIATLSINFTIYLNNRLSEIWCSENFINEFFWYIIGLFVLPVFLLQFFNKL